MWFYKKPTSTEGRSCRLEHLYISAQQMLTASAPSSLLSQHRKSASSISVEHVGPTITWRGLFFLLFTHCDGSLWNHRPWPTKPPRPLPTTNWLSPRTCGRLLTLSNVWTCCIPREPCNTSTT